MGKAEMLNNKGMLDLTLRKYSRALESFDKAITLDSNYAYAWGNRGITLLHLSRDKEALESVNRAIILNPSNSKFWNSKGCILIKHGALDEAEKCFRSAISIDSRNDEPWMNLGTIYTGKGEFDLADTFYDSALAIDKTKAASWFGKGQIANKLNDFDKAITFLDKAIELDPSNPLCWHERGFALANKRDYLAAEKCFQAALKLDPEYVESIGNLGEVSRRLGKLPEAEFFINMAIEKQPNDPNPWNNMGALLSEQGFLDKALACFEKALELNPNQPDALSNKIGVLGAMGRFGEAEALLNAIPIEETQDNPKLPTRLYLPGEMAERPPITNNEIQGSMFRNELVKSTLVALRNLQASRPSYVRDYLQSGTSLKETDFRDEFKRMLEMRFENIGAECKYGDGLADVRIQKAGSQLESMIFEFKIWGRNDYLDVLNQVSKYVTSFETHAAIVMINPNKKALSKNYPEKVILSHDGYVSNTILTKPLIPDSNLEHYSSKHDMGSGRIVTVFHFVLDLLD